MDAGRDTFEAREKDKYARRCLALVTTCDGVVVIFSDAFVHVSVLYRLKALTLKLYVCCAGTSLENLGQIRISRSSGQGQSYRSKKACLRVLFGL